jgi:DNA-binding transcriptional ArsR family regulator
MRRTREKRNAAALLDAVFGALSDATRRQILASLAQKECSVTELGEPFPISVPAISRHLRVLESAGLISRRKAGRVHYCRMRPNELQHAADWMVQQRAFWEQQFDSLARYLDEEEP